MSNTLTRDEIFAAQDLVTEEVPVPEWGAGRVVLVRAFNLGTRDAYYRPMTQVHADDSLSAEDRAAKLAELSQTASARLVAFSVVDAAGDLMFGDADVEALQKKSAKAIERITNVARRLNGLGEAAAESAAKN